MSIGPMDCFSALIFDSPMDWLIVLLIVLIFFGGRRIPEVMRGLGEGIRSFKDGVSGTTTHPTPQPPPAPPAAASTASTEKPVEEKK
ncbi:MAG: twin-arginine translocase TatA/TatE family subunit [Candidatus Acidiferrales bacterium]